MGGGGPKRGFSIQNFKVWLAIYQNVTKFDGEYDGAHPRNNWTNFFFRDLIKGLRGFYRFFPFCLSVTTQATNATLNEDTIFKILLFECCMEFETGIFPSENCQKFYILQPTFFFKFL